MDDVHINTTLTCPVAEFLGSTTPAIKHNKRDPGGTGKPAGGHERQPTRNMAISPICAAAVREVNRLYPTMSIIDFAQKGGVKYSLLQMGVKGDCSNFALLGRCSESCPYKHIARPMADKKGRIVKEALKLGLKNLLAKPRHDTPSWQARRAATVCHLNHPPHSQRGGAHSGPIS